MNVQALLFHPRMRDIPIRTPESLQDFRNLADRFRTNPGGLGTALMALRARGVDLNAPLDDQLPLYDALLTERTFLVRGLMDAGVDPMAASPRGIPLFWEAVAWNELKAVKAMLESSHVDPAWVNEAGKNALHLAASNGSIAMMEVLVRAGVDPFASDAEGKTPADVLFRQWASHAVPKHAQNYHLFLSQLPELRAPVLKEKLETQWQSIPVPSRSGPRF